MFWRALLAIRYWTNLKFWLQPLTGHCCNNPELKKSQFLKHHDSQKIRWHSAKILKVIIIVINDKKTHLSFQSKPMVPLQSDFDHGTQSHILTCYMFPQQPPADEGIYTSWFTSNQTLCLTHFHWHYYWFTADSNLQLFSKISQQLVRVYMASLGINPLTPLSDQDRISPYYIYTISHRQVMRIKKNINYGITNWFNTKFSKLV